MEGLDFFIFFLDGYLPQILADPLTSFTCALLVFNRSQFAKACRRITCPSYITLSLKGLGSGIINAVFLFLSIPAASGIFLWVTLHWGERRSVWGQLQYLTLPNFISGIWKLRRRAGAAHGVGINPVLPNGSAAAFCSAGRAAPLVCDVLVHLTAAECLTCVWCDAAIFRHFFWSLPGSCSVLQQSLPLKLWHMYPVQ